VKRDPMQVTSRQGAGVKFTAMKGDDGELCGRMRGWMDGICLALWERVVR